MTSLENSGPMTSVSTSELEALRTKAEFLGPITVCERCSGTEDAITSCIHCCRIPGHEDTCACKVCLWVRAYYEIENVLIKDRAKVKAGEQDTVRLARIRWRFSGSHTSLCAKVSFAQGFITGARDCNCLMGELRKMFSDVAMKEPND